MTSNEKPPMRDPYEILQLTKTATDDEIKRSYRKLALKAHPDKVGGSEELFKEVSAAYAILSDPEKRRNYDAKGFEGLDKSDFDVEIDVSQWGTMNTMVAAMFSKLGVPIRTAIAAPAMEQAMSGKVQIKDLLFGQPIIDKVDKHAINYYQVQITEKQAKDGIVIHAISHQVSKFKLLHFERHDDGALSLLDQEDSVPGGKVTTAGFYLLNYDTHRMEPPPSVIQLGDDPDSALFRRLDGMKLRETKAISKGTHIFAVYGDNWFNRAQFVLEAVAVDRSGGGACLEIQSIESELAKKQKELAQFESEYNQAKERHKAALERHEKETKELAALIARREQAYTQVGGVYSVKEPSMLDTTQLNTNMAGAFASMPKMNFSIGSRPASASSATSSSAGDTKPAAQGGENDASPGFKRFFGLR
ncbi:hypothetical protein CYMTET_20493 [Cymbomonas tetramitiformis]|uniref:J domain-containing protein n=1 Tax=Cymbomonas tetramitiformis TaxID=36881 RepID=A0AAE0G5A0_9CHLO|nr:hypothetical protein CYMTET_20493 [Cymbomonas tetramitiformis]